MRAPRLCPQRTSKWGGLPSTRRKAVRSVLPALVLLASPGLAFAEADAPPPRAAATTVIIGAEQGAADEWPEVLLWYFIWLYQNLGGDPNNVIGVPTVQCGLITTDYYWKYGMTPGQTEAQRMDFRTMIEATWAHLALAPSDFDQNALARYRASLRAMYADVGGDPDTLP